MSYIGNLHGLVISIEKDHLILDIQGVGYMVYVNRKILGKAFINQKLNLFIQQKISEFDVRLFGFLSKKDKDFFSFLLKINGVSARIAFSILDNCAMFLEAVQNKDAIMLERMPGVGKKIAQRLIAESGKFIEENFTLEGEFDTALQAKLKEVGSALQQLGYSTKDISAVLKKIDLTSNADVAALIKKSLIILGK